MTTPLDGDPSHRLLAEHAPDLLLQQSIDGAIRFASPAAMTVLGMLPEELVGRALADVCHPDDALRVRSALGRAIEHKETLTIAHRVRRRDRRYTWVETATRAILDPATGAATGAVSIVRDATERRQTDDAVQQAHTMDAVGRLAGGVAHDFNNLLTVIGAHAAFLMESLDSNDALHEDAEAIQKAGIRASGLTRQLLAFSRKQILKPSVLDLNSIIAEMENMLRRLLGEDIEIVTALSLELRSVIADAGQIEQVIMNLAVNARDAMSDGGTLTIGTRNVVVDESSGREHHMVGHGEYVVIDVSDTGIGMDAEVKARLFEPFFTTKEPGKGTGLGLATVYGVVKQSAGYVMVDSTPGEGTSFRVYLPAVEANTVQNDLRVAEDGAVRGIETILLVEDEPAVREIAKRILTQRGYIVLSASSGAEALSISAEFDSIIHLVISDSVMPGMTGAEAVRRLQEQRPALKALFMSGYTDDEILRRGIVASTAAFIQKPFMRNDFARAVREALDG